MTELRSRPSFVMVRIELRPDGTFQRLDSMVARIIWHMTREEGREVG